MKTANRFRSRPSITYTCQPGWLRSSIGACSSATSSSSCASDARRRQRPALEMVVRVETVDLLPLGQPDPAQHGNAIEGRHRAGPPVRVDDPVQEVGAAAARPLEDQHGTDVPRIVLVLRQEEHQVEHRYRDTHGFTPLSRQSAPVAGRWGYAVSPTARTMQTSRNCTWKARLAGSSALEATMTSTPLERNRPSCEPAAIAGSGRHAARHAQRVRKIDRSHRRGSLLARDYESRPYVIRGTPFNEYRTAYRYGIDSYAMHEGRSFDQAEPELMPGWELAKGLSSLTWDDAKRRPATPGSTSATPSGAPEESARQVSWGLERRHRST